jgi:hypothetical protein
MKLFIEDAVEIQYLLNLLDYDRLYIRDLMDEHMEENAKDFDEFMEIDDMFVSNKELTHRLERLAKKAGVDT